MPRFRHGGGRAKRRFGRPTGRMKGGERKTERDLRRLMAPGPGVVPLDQGLLFYAKLTYRELGSSRERPIQNINSRL